MLKSENSAKIEKIAIYFLLALLGGVLGQQLVSDGCVQFEDGLCTRCKRQTHLYEGMCYKNILGCIQYQFGSKCINCQSGIYQLHMDSCRIINGASATSLRSNLYKYSGEDDDYNPGSQYGESNFIPSSYDAVKGFPSFKTLDDFIRRGQYGHYISRMSNPVYSVHYYIKQETYIYKLLYHGSGGGLFLCIADVPSTLKVQLRSLTPISASNIIQYCYDYDINGKCMSCMERYHLERGRCYLNYGGCLKYQQNICLECMDYYFLVENRCTSDCVSVSDSRSILHYGISRNSSTLQSFYGLSIQYFYTVSIKMQQTNSYIEIVNNSRSNINQLDQSFLLAMNTTKNFNTGTKDMIQTNFINISVNSNPKNNSNAISNNVQNNANSDVLNNQMQITRFNKTIDSVPNLNLNLNHNQNQTQSSIHNEIIKNQWLTNNISTNHKRKQTLTDILATPNILYATNTINPNDTIKAVGTYTQPQNLKNLQMNSTIPFQTIIIKKSIIQSTSSSGNQNGGESMSSNNQSNSMMVNFPMQANITKTVSVNPQISKVINLNMNSSPNLNMNSDSNLNIQQAGQSAFKMLQGQKITTQALIVPVISSQTTQAITKNSGGEESHISTSEIGANIMDGYQNLDDIGNFQHSIMDLSNYQFLKDLFSSLKSKVDTTNQNCQQVDKQKRCVKCANFYFLNQNGVCEEISQLCIQLDQSGKCAKCFSGYTVVRGRCEIRNNS